jgi:hypothetical protein
MEWGRETTNKGRGKERKGKERKGKGREGTGKEEEKR